MHRYEDGSEETSWILQADHSISCDSAEYNGFWMAYAWLMVLGRCGILSSARVEEASLQVLVYPLGIPALYAYQLYTNRDKINPELPPVEGEAPEALEMRKIRAREADKTIRHLCFLFEERAPASSAIHDAVDPCALNRAASRRSSRKFRLGTPHATTGSSSSIASGGFRRRAS